MCRLGAYSLYWKQSSVTGSIWPEQRSIGTAEQIEPIAKERKIQRSFITEKMVSSLASAFVILLDLRGSSGRLTERVLLCISSLSLLR